MRVADGIFGTAVPLPAEDDDVGAVIASALLSRQMWREVLKDQRPCLREQSALHCFSSLNGVEASPLDYPDESVEDPAVTLSVAAKDGRSWRVTAMQPLRFHSLRHLEFGDDAEFCRLLRRSRPLTTKGGKSKANFWCSADGHLVLKEVKRAEAQHLAAALQGPLAERLAAAARGEPSVLCDVFGLYEVKPESSGGAAQAIIVMRNLRYGLEDQEGSWETFDLKGVGGHRQTPGGDEAVTVHWDSGFTPALQGLPLVLQQQDHMALMEALERDTEVLSQLGVVDYSMLILLQHRQPPSSSQQPENNPADGQDTAASKEAAEGDGAGILRLCLIDYLQPYSFEKFVESKVKKLVTWRDPTIVEPEQYRQRFCGFLKSGFEAAPLLTVAL
eukprot:TRINITY_DN32233_c1_g1_i1.p1 TRINITY_DN32233_c1_g1~~TRINITY_DN32233_c1_g1_i1.p1  ORF type:complete len:388 (-),score=100.29 TRINITY_DN32233_c1_g1_i1:90-1253(-)